jgi:hypothetical protein
MDDLAFLKEHVPDFEGYEDEIGRHHTDQRVRALVGSAMADLAERLRGSLPPDVETALSAAIFRCQFPDQTYTTRLDNATVGEDLAESLAQPDRQLVEIAERAPSTAGADVPALVTELNAAFDRRRQRAPKPVEQWTP